MYQSQIDYIYIIVQNLKNSNFFINKKKSFRTFSKTFQINMFNNLIFR